MKISEWTQKVTPCLFLVLVSLYAVLIVGVTGCGDDDDDGWVGTWAIETINGQSLEQSLEEDFEGVGIDLLTQNWTFDNNGTWEAEITLELKQEEGGSQSAVTSSIKTIGTYSLSGSN